MTRQDNIAKAYLERVAFRLKPSAKRVIDAFAKRQVLSSNLLDSDGRSLSKMGMGSEKVAVWRGPTIVITSTESAKSDQSIIRYLVKAVGKKNISYDYDRPGFVKALKIFSGKESPFKDQMSGWIAAKVPFEMVGTFQSGLTVSDDQWGPRTAGLLQWSSYQGKYKIESIEIRPELRRSGIASILYRKLFRDEGITKRDLVKGWRTEDGQAFRKVFTGSMTPSIIDQIASLFLK